MVPVWRHHDRKVRLQETLPAAIGARDLHLVFARARIALVNFVIAALVRIIHGEFLVLPRKDRLRFANPLRFLHGNGKPRLRRNVVQVPAHGEQRPLPVIADREVLHKLLRIRRSRAQFRAIRRQHNIQPLQFLLRHLVQPDIRPLLENNLVLSIARRKAHVEVRELRQLLQVLPLARDRPQVHVPVALAHKHDAIPREIRRQVIPEIVCQPLEFLLLKIADPHIIRHAATVAPPGPPLQQRPIEHHRSSVIVHVRVRGRTHRQLRRNAPGRGDNERLPIQLRMPPRAVVDDRLPVRRPTRRNVAEGMPRQPLRNAPRQRHHIHIQIPVILRRERQRLPVRRNMRLRLDPRIARKARRHPSRYRHPPQIPLAPKHNHIAAHIRETVVATMLGERTCRNHKQQHGEQKRTNHRHIESSAPSNAFAHQRAKV